MTQLPSQPTFNHALSVHIIIFVSFKCCSLIYLVGMEKMHIEFENTKPTRDNARAQILVIFQKLNNLA